MMGAPSSTFGTPFDITRARPEGRDAPGPQAALRPEPYPKGTIERWAYEYVSTTDLALKLDPPPPPRDLCEAPSPRRIARPGRPPELRVTGRAPKSPGPVALRSPERRASLVHTFFHHELQAAELFCWAILAFADAPEAFRRGLVGIMGDEIRHMGFYVEHLTALGSRVGAFPVRDWFWQRVPAVTSPAGFCATVGMGLEGANLDHAARFAERFRAVGDEQGARIQERIAAEEAAHVRFGVHWFERFTGEVGFAAWARALPPPLSPLLMRGANVDREARIAAGFPEAFVDELCAWQPR